MRYLWLLLLTSCAAAPTPSKPEFSPGAYALASLLFPNGPPWQSMDVIDTLQDPIGVEGWTRDHLLLKGDRAVEFPGVGDLRDHSVILAEVTSRGVELRNGRVIGLLRVWHWCGNDPISLHLARVDIDALLRHFPADAGTVTIPEGFDPRWGWDFMDFNGFQRRQNLLTRYLFRRDDEALAVFQDGWFSYARGRFEGFAKEKTRVINGYLPRALEDYLSEHFPIEGGRVDVQGGDKMDFVFAVLRLSFKD